MRKFNFRLIPTFFSSIRWIVLTIPVLILFPNLHLVSQNPGNTGRNFNSGTSKAGADLGETSDSTLYHYVFTDNIYQKNDISDSMADISFLHRTAILATENDYVNTGNLGSSSYPLRYRPEVNTGFNSGFNQYSLYNLSLDKFKFYEQNRPIADVYFSQLGNQENILVGANFSRNFSDGISVSLNYHRISQKGFYNSQDTKATTFGIGLRYQSVRAKYNAFLIFIHNANEEAHTGGILNMDDLNAQFKKDIPVILKEATTRNQENNIAFIQYYRLNKTKNKIWNIYVKNDIKYSPSYYKYADININDNNDSTFYIGIPVERRGLRRFLSVDQFTESIFINGERSKGIQGRIGLIYDLFNISNNPLNKRRSDLTAVFNGKIPFLKKLEIQTNARVGLLANAGTFDLNGQLKVLISKNVSLSGSISFFRSENSNKSKQLVLNEEVIYDTSFVSPVGSVINAELQIPGIRFSAGITQSLVNNPIYWDISGLPKQFNGLYSSTELRVKQNIKMGPIQLDNQAHFQILNSDIYPIPRFYSTHQIYYSGNWFKKVMDVKIGLDSRLITSYNGPAYQPLYGEFFQSQTDLPFFPAANLFFLARVSAFRAMFMMENFMQYFRKDHNFDVINHPQFDPTFRFKFQWLLKD